MATPGQKITPAAVNIRSTSLTATGVTSFYTAPVNGYALVNVRMTTEITSNMSTSVQNISTGIGIVGSNARITVNSYFTTGTFFEEMTGVIVGPGQQLEVSASFTNVIGSTYAEITGTQFTYT